MNQIPGDESSIQGHNVRGIYWTKPDSLEKVLRDKPIDGQNILNLLTILKILILKKFIKL